MHNSKKIKAIGCFVILAFLCAFIFMTNQISNNNTHAYAADTVAGSVYDSGTVANSVYSPGTLTYEVKAFVGPSDGASMGDIVAGPGSYQEGEEVTVKVKPVVNYLRYDKWTSISNDVVFSDPNSLETTFIMPGENVTVGANFVEEHFYHFVHPMGYWVEQAFPASVVFGYDGFIDAENVLQLNGAAHIVKGEGYGNYPGHSLAVEPSLLRLTPSDSEGGSVFTKNKIHLGEDLSFSTFFEFSLDGGGEGFTFTLQGDGNNTEDIVPSVSIAFDPLVPDGLRDKYNLNKDSQLITVFLNGNYEEDPEGLAEVQINKDKHYYVWIEYDGPTQTMAVSMNDIPDRNNSLEIKNLDLQSVFITDEDEVIKDVYGGFTAKTSPGEQREHNIYLWAFKNDPEPMYYYKYIFEETSRITLSADKGSNNTETTVTAAVYNKHNKPVKNIPVAFSTSFGLLSANSVVTDAQGRASVVLKSESELSSTAIVKAVPQGGALATETVQFSNFDNDVIADKDWLTEEKVLNGNDPQNVIEKLNMPTVGVHGSTISWQTSDDTVVALDGTVKRPSYIEGDKQITLTATLSKDNGETEVQKTFTITVKAMPQTDREAVAADKEWLTVTQTLGGNLSQYSIETNLELPISGPSGSQITWQSSKPAVIFNNGEVTRPGIQEDHQTVTLTATLKFGDEHQDTKKIQYTVLAEEDTSPPEVIDTTPEEDSRDVIFDTKQITIEFNEDIEKGEGWEEIIVGYLDLVRVSPTSRVQKFVDVGKTVRIAGNKLIVTLGSDMKSLRIYQIILPENAIRNLSGNTMSDEFTLEYKAEKVETGDLQVINSSPRDREENVSAEVREITFSYSDELEEFSKGAAFEEITLRNSSQEELPISREVDGTTVTLKLNGETELQLGKVYEISIPSGAFRDRFKRTSAPEIIKFKTRIEDIPPQIIKTYPNEEMNNVNIYQTIHIDFSEEVKADYSEVRLLDNEGNRVPSTISLYNNDKTMVIEPIQALKPETEYSVRLSQNSIRDYHKNYINSEYETNFTTGSNSLDMQIANISSLEDDISVDTSVKIQFSSAVTRGPEFGNIKIIDSQGNYVSFQSHKTDSSVTLKMYGNLNPSERYTIEIPRGAYKNINNDTNDFFMLKFITASPIKTNAHLYSASISVEPSSYYATNASMSFTLLENCFKHANREIISYEWTFGDGSKKNGKSVEHIYREKGKYYVELNIIDDKGFSYQFEKRVIIVESSLVNVSVSPAEHLYVRQSEDSGENTIDYIVSVPPEVTNLVDNVWVELHQTYPNQMRRNIGMKVSRRGEELGYYWLPEEINIPDDGTITCSLNYQNLPVGVYQLVLNYDALGKQERITRSFRVYRKSDNLSGLLELYDREDGQSSDIWDWDSIEVKVDGKTQNAKLKWVTRGMVYRPAYQITGVSTGDHEIQVYAPGNYYPSDKKEITAYYSNFRTPIGLEPLKASDRPILRYIKSEYTDSRNSKPTIFIDDDSVFAWDYMDLDLDIEVDWNGYEPGYLQLKTTSGYYFYSEKVDGTSTKVSVNLSRELGHGEGILARMVGKNGTKSPWVDAKLKMVPPPPSTRVLYYDIRDYKIMTLVEIEELMAGKIPVLEDIPLLNNVKSFGLNTDYLGLSGKFKDNTVKLTGGYNIQVNSAGYIIGSDVQGLVLYKYDYSSNAWKAEKGELKIIGTGGYEWKKSYTPPGLSKIPKIEKIIPKPYGKLIMKADTGGTILIKEDGSIAHEGILYFAPDVEVVIGAGNIALKIESYGGGRIDTEVHIPTGYVLVEPSLRVGARYTFLVYKGTLFERVAKTSWDNDKEKVVSILTNNASRSLLTALSSEDIQLKPMGRDYLARKSQWLAENQEGGAPRLLLMNVEDSNPAVNLMKDNIFPDAEVQLVENGNELWMLWTDDNPERSTMDRTQIMYSVLKDGKWVEPEWVGNDGTADFSPFAASTGDGVLMAWQNIKEPIKEDAEVSVFMENAEISVTESVYQADGRNVQVVTLTDDDKYDHSPKLAAARDHALLTWTKTDMEAAENSDRIYFSNWNGSTWSEPEEITVLPLSVIDSNLSMNGNEGLLLYTLDLDGNNATQNDQEIFARAYDGNYWREPEQITNNELADSNPKAVYSNGKWFITWYQDGKIMYKEGWEGEAKTEEFLSKVNQDYEVTMKNGDNPQIALVYQKRGFDTAQTLSASFYDRENGIWSDEIPLTNGKDYVRSADTVFTEDGKSHAAYTQAEVITEVIEDMEINKPSDKVDLRTLTYTPVHDLALDKKDGLQLSPEKLVPGTTVNVMAKIRNKGDFPENAVLYLYDGDPKDGGTKIGEAITKELIPARSSTELEIEWLLDIEERDKYDIYAVVKSDEGVREIDESNNTINHEVITADLAITNLEYEYIGKDNYMVTALIKNTGGRALEGVQVYLDNYKQNEQNEQPLQSEEIDQLEPGQEINIYFFISLDDLKKDENDQFRMSVTAFPDDKVEEFNRDNNVYEFELQPTPISVDSLDPSQGEKSADIDMPLIINFNMEVEQGVEFEQIILEDNVMNTISMNKKLAGNKLTITPQNPLEYDTEYSLRIPERALENPDGHTMSGSYELRFKTTTSSPEIVFVHPAHGLENVAVDTDINIQFNQNIKEELAFDEIKLNRLNSNAITTTTVQKGNGGIPVSTSLQNQWLKINPVEPLEKNTVYALLIPAGAVKNDRGEVLQEDFYLEFATGENDTTIPDKGTPPGDDNSKSDDNSSSNNETEDDKLLKKALNQEGIASLNIAKNQDNKAKLSVSLIKELIRENIPLNIENTRIKLSFPAASLATKELDSAVANASRLELGARELTEAEKQEILENAQIGEKRGLFDIGGKIFDLTAQLVDAYGNTTKIEKFNEPVAVTIDLSDINLTNEEIENLTGIRYEKDEQGNIVPVKLGGTYDTETKTFTFYTECFSLYGVLKGDKLTKISLSIGSLQSKVNDQEITNDVAPTIINNRTMVPLRFIAESMGADVKWDGDERKVSIELGDRLLVLIVDQAITGFDTPATIVNNRILVPIRYIAEMLNSQVLWFPQTREIYIVR